MWHMIVCYGNEPEREQLIQLARQCLYEKQIVAQISECANWQELDNVAKQTMPDIVIVAPDSVEGKTPSQMHGCCSEKSFGFLICILVCSLIACVCRILAKNRFLMQPCNRRFLFFSKTLGMENINLKAYKVIGVYLHLRGTARDA